MRRAFHRPFSIFLLLTLSLALAGCSGGSDGGVSYISTPSGGGGQSTTATITGRVTQSDTGTPIAGALVELDPIEGRGVPLRMSTQTDENGNYGFTGVEPGIHTLRVTAPDRTPWQWQLSVEAGETATQDAPCWPEPGQWVTFMSEADDLVAGDESDSYSDVFVRNLQTGETTKISVPPAGKEGGNSGWPVMSDCCRWVVFESQAQLVQEDDDDSYDVYRYDRQTGTMACLTLGYQFNKDYCDSADLNPNTSGNGRFTTYEWNVGFSEGKFVFVYDAATGETHMASVGPPPAGIPNACCKRPVVAAYGRYVAYDSAATNLVPNDDPADSIRDIYVYDYLEGHTEKVSMAADGSPNSNDCSSWPSISADGRYVAFRSNATNLVDPPAPGGMVYVRDMQEGTTTLASLDSSGGVSTESCNRPVLSGDGRLVAFETYAALVPEDTNGRSDIYVRDLQAGTTTLVSRNADGTGAGDDESYVPVIAFDGSYVLFESRANDLVTEQIPSSYFQVFLRTLGTALSSMVSQTPGGQPGNSNSHTRQSI